MLLLKVKTFGYEGGKQQLPGWWSLLPGLAGPQESQAADLG